MKKNSKKFCLFLTFTFCLSSCSTSERARQTTTNDYWDAIMSAYEEDMETLYGAYEDYPVTEDPFAGMTDEEKIKNWQEAHGNYVENESETASSYSPIIKNATGFYDGIAILEIDATGNDDTGFYAYNYYDKTFTLLNINEMPVDFSGTTAILKNESIISLTSGEIIMSPDKDYTRLIKCNTSYHDNSNYFVYSNDYDYYFGDYLIAYNIKESFDGNVYSLGIINNNGEWVTPLSSDLKVFKTISFNTEINSFNYLGNGVVKISGYAYSFLDDTIICELSRGFYATDKLIITENTYGDWRAYNRNTNEWIEGESEYIEEIVWISDKGMLLEKYDEEKQKRVYFIVDHDFNVIHDLSEYTLVGEEPYGRVQFTETMAAFSAEGASGDTYFCIIDKNGEFDFEPIKIGYGEENYLLEENRIFMYFDNHAILDFDTNIKKNITTSRENATLYTPSYDPKTDTFLCKVDVPLEYFGTTPSYFFIHSDGTEVLASPIQIN